MINEEHAMKMKTVLSIVFSGALLAACSGGAGGGGAAKGPVSEARTTAFKTMMPEYSSMGKMVKGDETYDVEKFKAAAATFSENARKPFEHFASDPQGNGDALPAIWEKPAQFDAEREKFLAAVDDLNAKAQAGNLEEIKVAYGNVGASCKSCHDAFRQPK